VLWRNLCLAFAFTALLETPEPQAPIDFEKVTAGPAPSVLEMDPHALAALEQKGFALHRLFRAGGDSNEALAATSLFRGVLDTLTRDLAELNDREYVGPQPLPHRPFVVDWLRDPRGHFELVGAVHRLDRSFVEPNTCGEARLVYRLALKPKGRPVTRLPMTLNVIFPQRSVNGSCAHVARAWNELPAAGRPRVEALAAIFRSLPSFTKVETNLQNLHSPALGPDDEDKAEYLLRSFERRGDDSLVAKPLLDTPRPDLSPAERDALAKWIREHFAEIDAGSYVIPDAFLAMRTVSMAPRGTARIVNRTFARLYGDGAAAFADLPYDRAKLVRSPHALVRRLDQGTCTGCHETRSIAGFHLLGEEPDPDARINAMVVGKSTHLNLELRWRAAMVEAIAAGNAFAEPRPYAERRAGGPGGPGAHCALPGETDPVFATWTCATGLRCRDLHHDEIGQCVSADGNHEGDACQETRPGGPNGEGITLSPLEECVLGGIRAHECAPTHYGFAGGLCSRPCEKLGRTDDERHVCVDLPASGYEMDCMLLRTPIEECIPTHVLRRRVARCDATHACRDDYLCARIPGLAITEGACVPSYFVFQTRVDGPLLDR